MKKHRGLKLGVVAVLLLCGVCWAYAADYYHADDAAVAECLRKLVEENARVRRDQKEYQREYDRLVVEYDRINAQIQAMEDRNRDKGKRRRKLEIFLGFLEKKEVREAFEPYTFATMVEKAVVQCDGRLEFCFRNGMQYAYQMTI